MAGLLLTLREGETVMIGDDVSVCVQMIQDNRVSVRFVAPPEVPVDRLEVWNRIRKQGGRRRRWTDRNHGGSRR